jgi:hypothetical protein
MGIMKNLFKSKLFKIIALAIALVLIVVFIFALKRKDGLDTPDGQASTAVEEAIDHEPTHAEILDEASEEEDSGDRAFYMPKEEVYSFTITDANGIVMKFERSGSEWIYLDDETIDLSEERMDKLLNYLTDVKFIDSISTDDASEYGLDQNSKQFAISDENGNSTVILLGNTNDDGNVYFALNYDFSTIFVNGGKLNNISDYSVEELVAIN